MKLRDLRNTRATRLILPAAGAVMALLVILSLARGASDTAGLANLMERYRASADGVKPDQPGGGEQAKRPEGPGGQGRASSAPSGPNGAPGSAGAASAQEQQAQRIAKANPFARPEKFQVKLTGVLGDKAYFEGNNEAVAVGQDIRGAKVKEIGPDWVDLEREGKTQREYVWSNNGGGPGGGGPPGMSGPGRPMRGPSPEMMSGPSRGGPGPSSMPDNMTLPPEMLQRAIEEFKKMSPEQQQKALQDAPPSIREQVLKAL